MSLFSVFLAFLKIFIYPVVDFRICSVHVHTNEGELMWTKKFSSFSMKINETRSKKQNQHLDQSGRTDKNPIFEKGIKYFHPKHWQSGRDKECHFVSVKWEYIRNVTYGRFSSSHS